MSDIRNLVLDTLLKRQRCTINDLAEVADINPISMRHHIAKLEAEGLVSTEVVRKGVGRPHHVYFLTNAGMEKFPQRYLSLSIRILEQLKETLPQKTVKKLFKEIASNMVDDHTAQVNLMELDLEERVELITQLLQTEGFSIEISEIQDGVRIKESSCPYKHVGQDHPEICLVDETIIEKVLDTEIEKTHCVLNGDPFCAYIARMPKLISEIKISEK
jgi:DeoR family suf operon transcriptional repressor